MAESFDTGSTFTLRELTGQQRTVVMQQRGLPYRPFTLKTSQRVTVSWNPGYSIGTGNVMGATEPPCTLNGAWKTKYLGETGAAPCITVNGSQVSTAREAVTLFDSLCREGQEIEVTWDEDVRVGYLNDVESSRHNKHDIDYALTFTWISRGQAATAVVLASSVSLSSSATSFRARANAIMALVANPPYPMVPKVSALLGQTLLAFDTAVAAIEGAASTVTVLATSPLNAASAVVAACNTIVSTGKGLRRTFQTFRADASNQAHSLGDQTYGQSLEAKQYMREIQAETQSMTRYAIATRAAYVSRIEQELLGIYEARQNDDLRTISQTYYGTPFQWQTLAVFNNLVDFSLHPGDIILVPKITALSTS